MSHAMPRPRHKVPANITSIRLCGALPDVAARCEHEEIARRLYRATIDLLRWSDDPAGERHFLLEPLSKVVAAERTRTGQALCARLEAELARGDFDAALDACIALIEHANARVEEARTAAAATIRI